MKYSELRQDLVSGDWILIAPGRARKPEEFLEKRERLRAPKEGCPFENLEAAGGGEMIAVYTSDSTVPRVSYHKDWRVQLIPNKYPAVFHDGFAAKEKEIGPYKTVFGAGYHDLLITKDHNANFPRLSKNDANLVFRAFRDRYAIFLDDPDVAYISIFHNWGPKAGASVYHPHYQMIALPVIPPDVEHSLAGSKRYFQKNRRCVHCVQLAWEKKERKRIIYENNCAVVFAPFVSKSEFEIRIFPKQHLPFFEDTPENIMDCVVEALQKALKLMEKSLKDPDYNFFIHTAPLNNKNRFSHYHWHIEIIPKINIPAGFELGTGIEINVVDPDEAAKHIRKR
ncbi:MAG: hypothetical protein COX15_00370 [Candidatus Colwellbacteria bacterium CG23_combo_of_CG06-09_8_20_14_all_42_19]|uniref:DUF4921 domain-containing protein n=1 Tax=Candidatus Colwellbacteria bacterium CG23_combo_of_CG06-09_8_20_14_all_42_19 TaxID=1974541 RepID=A0A2H0AMA9_9BACT|nr:MAG: hypothetical protein COX15_00370 [Candidatus Colwellbacteria bacterium CG23_combo_of_CG06-09_8_20_14_all_42_19]